MCSQYQGDVDDGLHIYFAGSNCLLGNVVVVSGYFRFEGILPQSDDSRFQLPKKMRLLTYDWTEKTTNIFHP
jgi:hypothetical protein